MKPCQCVFLAAFVAAVAVGCAPNRIEVQRNPVLADVTVSVDFVGPTPGVEFDRYVRHSAKDYWSPGDALRREARDFTHEVRFVPGRIHERTIPHDAQIWRSWRRRNARELVVFADIPGIPNPDDAKVVVPLQRNRYMPWWNCLGRPVPQIEIRESGVILLNALQ